MKTKIILSLALLSTAAYAQQETMTTTNTVIVVTDPYPMDQSYNRWSLDAQFGLNYAQGPLTTGYSTNEYGLYHLGLGTRYMFNPKFGLKLSVGYDEISEGFNSPNFHTDYFRSSLEGVINLAALLDFNCRFGLLAHGGAGYSLMTGVNMTEDFDHIMNVTAGITPQYMLSNRLSIYGDVSAVSNVYQDYNYDFARTHTNRGFDGNLFNFSVGLQFNFGDKNKRYADFVYGDPRIDALRRDLTMVQNQLNNTDSEVDRIQRDMMDSDGDGVADYLDQEANTPSGVLVDTKGRGIQWYAIYQELDQFNSTPTTDWTGYLNRNEVLFETEKSDVAPAYYRSLNNMAIVMINNPNYKLSVIGHADDRGEKPFNLDLSKNRADAVKNYLVSKGVAEDRIIASGVGEVQPEGTKPVTTERKHNRRVEFVVSTTK